MYKLKQSQWDILLSEIERKSSGADIHNNRQQFGKAKDCIEMICKYKNGDNFGSRHPYNAVREWEQFAIDYLKKHGHDDFNLFIENKLE